MACCENDQHPIFYSHGHFNVLRIMGSLDPHPCNSCLFWSQQKAQLRSLTPFVLHYLWWIDKNSIDSSHLLLAHSCSSDQLIKWVAIYAPHKPQPSYPCAWLFELMHLLRSVTLFLRKTHAIWTNEFENCQRARWRLASIQTF